MVLKRMRRFIQLLQSEGNEARYSDLVVALKEAMAGDVVIYLVDKQGKILSVAHEGALETTEFDEEWMINKRIPEDLNTSLLKIGAVGEANVLEGYYTLVAPVVGNGRRVGSALFVSFASKFKEDDIVVAEFGATSIGMIIGQTITGIEEDEAQEVRIARSAINSLSYSEILAMQHIFDELEGDEGLLVASRIADNAGITRSVIVNALRKLASANVVESRSLGMKGTYLRILNREIRNEFERQRYPYPKTPLRK